MIDNPKKLCMQKKVVAASEYSKIISQKFILCGKLFRVRPIFSLRSVMFKSSSVLLLLAIFTLVCYRVGAFQCYGCFYSADVSVKGNDLRCASPKLLESLKVECGSGVDECVKGTVEIHNKDINGSKSLSYYKLKFFCFSRYVSWLLQQTVVWIAQKTVGFKNSWIQRLEGGCLQVGAL
jgi:hypothetical protein